MVDDRGIPVLDPRSKCFASHSAKARDHHRGNRLAACYICQAARRIQEELLGRLALSSANRSGEGGPEAIFVDSPHHPPSWTGGGINTGRGSGVMMMNQTFAFRLSAFEVPRDGYIILELQRPLPVVPSPFGGGGEVDDRNGHGGGFGAGAGGYVMQMVDRLALDGRFQSGPRYNLPLSAHLVPGDYLLRLHLVSHARRVVYTAHRRLVVTSSRGS